MPSAAPADEHFPRRATLRRPADYQLCYRTGWRRQGALVTLLVRPNAGAAPLLGLTASRKVGGAVVRNRLRRWTRETFRRWPGRRDLPPCDLVVHFKPAAREATHEQLALELTRLFSEALRPPPGRRRTSS